MKQLSFLFCEELKKVLRSRYIYTFALVIVLDMIAFASEYTDRLRSVLYNTGVHVRGQGSAYLFKHEYGPFGVLVLYLIPILILTAPVFSDEYINKMADQIRVTENGRSKSTIVKIFIVITFALCWIVFLAFFSSVMSFAFFDTGVSALDEEIITIGKEAINVFLGCYMMGNLFLLFSTLCRNTVGAVTAGFVAIILPMFIESEKKIIHLFPIIGMQAESLLGRSFIENSLIWSFYAVAGSVLFLLNFMSNK